ncbi:high affinity copper uptake protein 1-like [Dysidea avara]|uniref:high affinity copper uptake protein 1-like n=1 Tax=Dysidea avara TaxID=196820 RepID=UPI003321C98D
MDMNCTMPMNCSMTMGPMKMQMYFYFGVHNVTVLFEGWDVDSVGAMVGTFFAIFVMALLYEGLKVFREVLHRNKSKMFGKIGPKAVQYTKLSSSTQLVPKPNSYNIPVGATLGVHIIQTLLHMLQVTISYFLMLIAMTYNVWLFIAIVLGAGAGYFLFARFRGPGTQSGQDSNEHCH